MVLDLADLSWLSYWSRMAGRAAITKARMTASTFMVRSFLSWPDALNLESSVFRRVSLAFQIVSDMPVGTRMPACTLGNGVMAIAQAAAGKPPRDRHGTQSTARQTVRYA